MDCERTEDRHLFFFMSCMWGVSEAPGPHFGGGIEKCTGFLFGQLFLRLFKVFS